METLMDNMDWIGALLLLSFLAFGSVTSEGDENPGCIYALGFFLLFIFGFPHLLKLFGLE